MGKLQTLAASLVILVPGATLLQRLSPGLQLYPAQALGERFSLSFTATRVFVSGFGSNTNAGTLARPVHQIQKPRAGRRLRLEFQPMSRAWLESGAFT